jgi:UDP-N-acetylmuramoylalanine--D-glutamate ligase
METVKAPTVGITGSAGKTTTTTLFGRMAQAEMKPPRQAWVGGNIGNPLIEFTSEINTHDLVIQELSSFQLELMTTSPRVAAVLNITPNHLDRHAGMADYIRAKSRILAFQDQGDIAVLNREDAESWKLRSMVHGSLVSFGREKAALTEPQVYLQDGAIWAGRDCIATRLLDTSLVSLRGAHNLMNVLAACALAVALDFSPDAMTAGIKGFNGVKHRLQLVRVVNGVSWFNDSIATAPERTLAALNSFNEPVVLLLGGRDKNLPWEPLAKSIHERVDHVVIFGEAREKITTAIGEPKAGGRLQSVVSKETMLEALTETAGIVSPGDVVLLSPGCTSYDAFKDFEERGETFIDWVNGL